MTLAALNTIGTFLACAPLPRAEHADANKSVQHVVRALESQTAAGLEMPIEIAEEIFRKAGA